MKPAGIVPLAIVFAATCASATPPLVLNHSSCPIDLQVKHGSGFALAEASGPPPSVLYQRLHLTMINLLSQDIVSAQITVHGFSNKSRTMELSNTSNAPDLARTVDLALGVKGNSRASRDLTVGHFTAVTDIDVNSVTYADGSTWNTSSPGACRVSPDLLMLVSATP